MQPLTTDPRTTALAAARAVVAEITPADALACQQSGAILIDVREAHEFLAGAPAAAINLPRSSLELNVGQRLPDAQAALMLICASGNRSLLAARSLHDLGYVDVVSVVGGFTRWQREALPTQHGAADGDWFERYSRHLRLDQIGVEGQQRLGRASILVVGAGGLGSPAAFYLAAAGVGRIGLVDDDRVDRSNLQRQILHADARVGVLKVESARIALQALNPRVEIVPIAQRLSAANVDVELAGFDVVLDGSDNFATRYLLSDACVKHSKPLVYGAVQGFDGQVSVFDAGRHRGLRPCYRCLFPEPPPADAAPNCAEAGVLGVLPGVVGLLQATEALKLVLGIGETLAGRILSFDALTMRFRETRLAPDPSCPLCAPNREFPGYIDYTQFCARG